MLFCCSIKQILGQNLFEEWSWFLSLSKAVVLVFFLSKTHLQESYSVCSTVFTTWLCLQLYFNTGLFEHLFSLFHASSA